MTSHKGQMVTLYHLFKSCLLTCML